MNSEAAELRLAVANISREKTDVVHEALMMNADLRKRHNNCPRGKGAAPISLPDLARICDQ